MGKGDTRRPQMISNAEMAARWELAFGKPPCRHLNSTARYRVVNAMYDFPRGYVKTIECADCGRELRRVSTTVPGEAWNWRESGP